MVEPTLPIAIECPRCEELIEESTHGSILASLRCGSCGHMLAFDEVVALRAEAKARSAKYA